MPLPIGPVLGILSDNLRKRGSVLPLSKSKATGWAKGLNIPRGGKTVLYTGLMYQLIPSIDALASQMAAFENSTITRFFGLGRFANQFIDLSYFMSLTESKEMRLENDRVLRNIAGLLRKAGVEFGYLYERELYSGALVYDGGMDESFGIHARRVFEVFRKNGVRCVITVDPHTTSILREIYPKFVQDFDLDVKNYMEVLAEKDLPVIQDQNNNLVIHDSCVYARYEGMIEQPRNLLTKTGVTVNEPELTSRSTYCCGGPIESLFPSKAHEIAASRVSQLRKSGEDIVTMCPICLVNLRKAAGESCHINDISNTLANGYLPQATLH
jgi:Fe-S oxidoreductase